MHNYLWGSHDVDTRGEVIERFTNIHNLCILNDGTHTYLKPQAQHANKPTSAIDLTISTPGLALRSVWEVLQDTHGSDHYPILTSILPSVAEMQPSCDPSHWVFSKANWEQFHDVCLESISEDILEEADPLHSFVEHITKAANDCIPRATTIPKKSNPWFDEECREALKARRALDKRVWQSRELRGETISAFRRSQVKARRLFNQKKRQSWAEYVSKLSAETPIKHVWDRVRKISGKNIYPPKQYLKGKNGTTITDPKDIANEHGAVFPDNSSSARYSATFQAIKEQEKVKIDFTSDNTEVYNKPFQLRDLRRSIMKAKPRAPGPDGIHNNLLKHLPEDTLKILKEILNKIWISADFPQQWRAATVIPIPKPNKDHTDPLSYRPIALTSCLCKVMERMINTHLIWYLEKYRLLDRSQCGLENIVARPTTWWALKDISGMPLLRGNRQLVSSLTWRKPMRQPGNMASSETFTGLASEADCLFLFQNISGTGESESELGRHSLMNSTQRKVFQLAVSWLWHVLDWRLMSCPLVLPRAYSKHSLSMTWRSVFEDALWTP